MIARQQRVHRRQHEQGKQRAQASPETITSPSRAAGGTGAAGEQQRDQTEHHRPVVISFGRQVNLRRLQNRVAPLSP